MDLDVDVDVDLDLLGRADGQVQELAWPAHFAWTLPGEWSAADLGSGLNPERACAGPGGGARRREGWEG